MELPKLVARRCLLLCARSRSDGGVDLESLLHQGVDWAFFLDQGLRHGLLPLVYYRLRRVDGDLVPPGVMADLEASYYLCLRRNIYLRECLVEVLTALHKGGIEPIVLKGGALTGTVYANPGLRPMGDLDLLVSTEAMEQAGAALSSIGYRLAGKLSVQMVTFQQRFGGGLEWVREDRLGPTYIDLQHDLVGVDFCRHAFPIKPEALCAAALPLPLDREEGLPQVQTLRLSAEDTLIHLCLHQALHHGYAVPLRGVVDMDWLVASEGSADFWQRVTERAGQWRAGIVLYWGLRRSRDLLGTPVPADTLEALAPSALRQRLLAWLAPLDEDCVWLGVDQQPSGLRQLLLYVALMERPRDALGMVLAILFPGQEWLLVRYGLKGKWWARLYRLIHPLRVARAFLRGLHRPLVRSSLE